jgi:hypothetical protein
VGPFSQLKRYRCRLAWALCLLSGTAVSAEKGRKNEQVVSAIPFQQISKIQIASEISKVSPYIRVKNLVNGRTLEIPIEDRDSIDLKTLYPLVDQEFDKVLLEFSLYFLEKRSQEAVRGQLFDGTRETVPTLSPRRYQPAQAYWRRVGYQLEPQGKNHVKIYVKAGIRTIFISEQDAQKRREAVELLDSRDIFDKAWKALHEKRYDLALGFFNEIIRTEKLLNASQITQARMGRGISRFHQLGCAGLEEDFVIADRNPDNHDDLSYYRGLCAVEAKNFKSSRALFETLIKKKHKNYEEPARFYFALSSEMLGDVETAQEEYLDVVDFAADPKLVTLAKDRLKYLEEQANKTWKPSWLTLGFASSAGYDSNVIGLPPSVTPGSRDLSSEASPSLLLAPLVNFHYLIQPGVIQSWRYTFAGLYYFNSSIEDLYGMFSHDLSTMIYVAANDRNNHLINVGANSVSLGGLSSMNEFMRLYTVDYSWIHLSGDDPTAPNISWTYGFKTQLQLPQQEATSDATDLEAYAYQLSLTRVKSLSAKKTRGLAFRFEYKPSAGTDNSVIDGGSSFSYGRPLWGFNSWKLDQSIDLDAAMYYQSTSDRKDLAAKYNISISKSVMDGRLDMRLAFQYHMNFSTVSESYRYNKYTSALSLSGSF